MNLDKVDIALSALKDFPSDAGTGEDLAYLSARFCDSLADLPAYDELRRRAAFFDKLTGPGSDFDDARSELCKLCSGNEPTQEAEGESATRPALDLRLTIAHFWKVYGERFLDPDAGTARAERGAHRALLPAEAQNPNVMLRWWCMGQHTIYDAEWVRCNLFTVFAITECAVQAQADYEFDPVEVGDALAQFRDQLWSVWRQSDREHLLGAYLLTVCQDAVDAGIEQCRKLVDNLGELDMQAKAVCAAAEDLYDYLAISEEIVPEATDGQTKAGSRSGDRIDKVTVSFGEKRCQLEAEGREPFLLTEDETRLFILFARLVAIENPTELVTWRFINKAIGREDPQSWDKQHPQVAKLLSMLNGRLRGWGIPPDGKHWIGSQRSKRGGRRLNETVKWVPHDEDETMRTLARKSISISSPLVDPHKVATSTPDREHKLPARPRRDTDHRWDEEERS